MEDYQREFIDFAIEQGVLKFGEFQLKSGRKSPYFFNSGNFSTGKSLSKLAKAYAQAAVNSKVGFNAVFGPAYKGIPLSTSLALALYENHNINVPYTFDRKEEKDHGEGGNILGNKELKGSKVLVIDDVITSGLSIRYSVEFLQKFHAKVTGVLIALDRQERGQGEKSSINEIEEDMSIKVTSIISAENLIEYLEEKGDKKHVEAMKVYRSEYGC